MIALEKIQRRWGTFSLSVTLAVPEGKYMVILGPSGCGKSLLLGWCASALATSVFTAFAESHLLMPLLGILLAPAGVSARQRADGPPTADAPPPPPR